MVQNVQGTLCRSGFCFLLIDSFFTKSLYFNLRALPGETLMFSALKTIHFMPCFAIFFSAENINAENVSVFGRIFQC
jgi:hypothetical protein